MANALRTMMVRLALPFIACVSLTCASLANFLVHHDYPFLRVEVIIVVAALIGLSLAAAPVFAARGQWLRSIAEGLLTAIFIELNTTSLPLALAAGGVLAAVTYWKRISLTGPMALFGGVVLVTTLLGLGGRTPWITSKLNELQPFDRSKPAVVHLILDEHIGIEGLDDHDPDAKRLASELRSFYLDEGFATFGGAYSEHMRTANAIPHVLQFGAALGHDLRGNTVVVGRTRYLENLLQRGYRLNVIQSDFADFCFGSRVQECVTYQASSPSALVDTRLTSSEQAGLLATKFLSLSEIAKSALLPWRVVSSWARSAGLNLPRLDPDNLARSTSVTTLRVFEELTRRLYRAEPGNVYFAHLLLPHYPYAFSDDCSLLRWQEWKKPFAPRNISVRRKAYYAQVRCTTRRVKTALDALARSHAGPNAIVIIHGDHGSRITDIDPSEANIGKFSDADLVAAYSTHFAVRSQQINASYSTDRQPISVLLKTFAASGFTTAPSPPALRVPTVHLDGPGQTPGKRVKLPAFRPRRQ